MTQRLHADDQLQRGGATNSAPQRRNAAAPQTKQNYGTFSLDLSRLENVKQLGDGSVRAACPACRAAGTDKSREHLLIKPTGQYGCAVFPNDHEHRKEIFKLAASRKSRKPNTKTKCMVNTYPYYDAAGKMLFEVVRYAPKDFRQRRPSDNGHWIWGLTAGEYVQGGNGDWFQPKKGQPFPGQLRKSFPGREKVLFRLPEIVREVKHRLRIFVCEGEKDVLAMVENGLAATCNAGGARKWQDSFSETLRGADVTIIEDKDDDGRAHAQLVAEKLRGIAKSVSVLEMPDINGKRVKDAADFFAAGGNATHIAALADGAMAMHASQPYKPGNAPGEGRGATNARGGERMNLTDPEPWSSRVDGGELLNDICGVLRRYVVAPPAELTVCALFVIHTYAFDLGDVSPILFITGPTKRCGKSRLLSVLARLVNRPLVASSASAAGIYRTIELCRPTLLIDEVDSFMRGNERLRGLVNSGHTRDQAYHLGCVAAGSDYEPRQWSTWAPKILSGIGRLADTIEDRALIVRMRRRRKDEAAERLRHGIRFEETRRKCVKFVSDNAEAIRSANPEIPDGLNDRAADNWATLLALADLAGGDWPNSARRAALELSGSEEAEALGINTRLLADIRQIFNEAGTDRLASKDLCERLVRIEGRPWAEFGKHQKQISPNQLANLLKEFGIMPRGVRIGEATPRGYYRDDFADAFSSYLAVNAEPKCNNATRSITFDESSGIQSATPEPRSVSKNATLTNNDANCCSVAVQKAEAPPERIYV
jgi:hypothetical protein